MAPIFKITDPKSDPRWNKFIDEHPQGTLYHLSAWSNVLSETFGYQPLGILMENQDSDQIKGVMPLMVINRPLYGKRVACLPMTTYCNNLIPDQFFPDAIKYIQNMYPNSCQIELKYLTPLENQPLVLQHECTYVDHIVELNKTPEEFYNTVFHKDMKRKIKKANKHDLKYRVATDIQELYNFYHLLMRVRKKHQLPPMPITFFKKMWELLRPKGLMFLHYIESDGEMVAAESVLQYKDTYHLEYGASKGSFHKLGANQMLFYETIKSAYKNGIKHIDLGRSHQSHKSLILFKERSGASPHPLHYYYHPDVPKNDVRKYDWLYKKFNWLHYSLPINLMDLEARLIFRFFG